MHLLDPLILLLDGILRLLTLVNLHFLRHLGSLPSEWVRGCPIYTIGLAASLRRAIAVLSVHHLNLIIASY